MKKLTTEEFIRRAKLTHGDKYNYDKTYYHHNKNKLIITCSKHGDFNQYPSNHLRGNGCSKCNFEKDKYSQIEFIEKAKQIHGKKYDYSKVIYIDSYTYVIIICKEHGSFNQIPASHLQGHECLKCCTKNKALTQNEFINKAKVIHGNKYEYSKSVYKNNHTKLIITCAKHGDFNQQPMSHLIGKGCSICSSSKGELAIKAILDKHNIKYEPQYNIPEIVNNYKIDFYLPEYRLLVEFHGIQHYEYIPFFHDGDYTFEDQKTRDDMVRDAAIRWKYNYLEFNYKQLKYLSEEQFEKMILNSINKNFLNIHRR